MRGVERSPALPKTLPWEAGTQPEWGAPNLKAQGFPTGDRPDPDTESEGPSHRLEAERGRRRCAPVLVQVPHTPQAQKFPEAVPMAASGPEGVRGGFFLWPCLCSTCGGTALSPQPETVPLLLQLIWGEGRPQRRAPHGLPGPPGSGLVVTQASQLGYGRAYGHSLREQRGLPRPGA